ncbi:hypothetical protein WDL1P1_00307 (plasmid) [Variovorax sp. WDL1]|nr:hypothetical protein WDL1P1_00307 [Variovorax sp. WDL1]
MDRTITSHLVATRSFVDAFLNDMSQRGRARGALVPEPSGDADDISLVPMNPMEVMRVASDWRRLAGVDQRAERVAQALEVVATARRSSAQVRTSRVARLFAGCRGS